MASDDFLNRDNFGLLPEPRDRMASFGLSTIVNLVIASILLLLTMNKIKQAEANHYYSTQLVFAVKQPKFKVPRPTPAKIAAPLAERITAKPPLIVATKATRELIKPEVVKLDAPPMPAMPASALKKVAPSTVAENKIKPSPKTGGFGDPMGVTPNPNSGRPATIATVGSFALSVGSATGVGAARGSIHGTSFGSGVASGAPNGAGQGTVASTGFSGGTAIGTPAARAPTGFVQPSTTPMIVLDKPRPAYTAEARLLKIEGDVTLNVRFRADGRIQILGVVNGLGHGLNEEAARAVEQIRYKPATQNGQPVDQVSLIHVTFQLT
jgi:TonB family protein